MNDKIIKFINKPFWSFIGVIIGIPGILLIITENSFQNITVDSIKWILISGAFIFSLSAYYKPNKINNVDRDTLRDIAIGNKDRAKDGALWSYGHYGYSGVQINDAWKEWIESLLITTNRKDLDYYNFGNEFHFIDLYTGKTIDIPTDNRAKNEKVGNSNLFRNGMILRLMPKDST